MGITIHYRGRIKPKEAARNIYIMAKLACQENKWEISPLSEGEGTIQFEKYALLKEYHGPIHSFVIQPHEHCEPVTFQITKDGFFEDRCKTQFAPVEIHIAIVHLLDGLKGRFSELIVEDEGHFWEIRKRDKLEHNIMKCYEEILKSKEEDPAYYGPVKDEDGRITDLVKEE